MLTDLNQLPPPDAIYRPTFDELVAQFKSDYLNNIRTDNAALADQVEQTLEQPGELLTKMCETFVQYLLNEIERRNQQARQLLPAYATGSNLDNLVAHQGIQRQVLVEGDPDAYPPIPTELESDEDLLLRYLLQPHAPAAGSQMQYKASLLTLDEKPVITIDKPSDNQVQLTYTFNAGGMAAQIKDGNAFKTDVPGQVLITVLQREMETEEDPSETGQGQMQNEQDEESENTVTQEALLQAVRNHFARDDIGPGTDEVIVQAAENLDYDINVSAIIGKGPDTDVIKKQMENALQDYAEQQYRLGGVIQQDYIKHILFQNGAKSCEVTIPSQSEIQATEAQAPHCNSITVEVNRE